LNLAGLRSGDGPLSVRARPSSIKRDCDRRTTSTGERCLVNVREVALDPGDLCGHSGQGTRARPEPARTGRGPSPARCGRSPGSLPEGTEAVVQGPELTATVTAIVAIRVAVQRRAARDATGRAGTRETRGFGVDAPCPLTEISAATRDHAGQLRRTSWAHNPATTGTRR
jgi:hypothetical protein